jgi:hypothetical protein
LFTDHKFRIPGESPEVIVAERPASPSVKTERLIKTQQGTTAMEDHASAQEESDKGTGAKAGDAHGFKADSAAPLSPDLESTTSGAAEDLNAFSTEPTTAAASVRKMSSGATSLLSPTIPFPKMEDPIDAIDALEDAIEEVGKILPKLDPAVSPEKPKTKKPDPMKTTSVQRASRVLAAKTQTPVAKSALGKASLSKSTNVKPVPSASLTKSTQPSSLSRSTSVRATPSNKPTVADRLAAAANRRSMIGPAKDGDNKAGSTTIDYLASRRRPMSVQFPPPAPPPKSSKAPTQPTFSLPGESIAAKRKSEREARLKREEEEAAKRREFKARPAPSAGKPRPASMIVRQTANSRARLSIIGPEASTLSGKENAPKSNTGLKRSGTVTGATNRNVNKQSIATKRSSMIVGKSAFPSPTGKPPMSTTQKRTSVAPGPGPGRDAPRSSSITVPKRGSLMASTQPTAASRATSSSTSRNPSVTSLTAATNSKSIVTAGDAAAQRQKAKEIFNRDRVDKENRERERKEKETAAKRARLEASEKGRQASREWAEKQKKKLSEAKQGMMAQKAIV